MAPARRPAEKPENPLDDLSKRGGHPEVGGPCMSNREVGEALDLQEKTVKHYMTLDPAEAAGPQPGRGRDAGGGSI